MTRPARIISGGQTGADLGGLRAGKILGIPTGGLMPKGWVTELGSRPWMRTMYHLTEHESSKYRPRTEANVQAADMSLIFGDLRSPGSRTTKEFCQDYGKLYLVNPSVERLQRLIQEDFPRSGRHVTAVERWVVNVAGNRQSSNYYIEEWVMAHLVKAWGTDEQSARVPYPRITPRFSPAEEME